VFIKVFATKEKEGQGKKIIIIIIIPNKNGDVLKYIFLELS